VDPTSDVQCDESVEELDPTLDSGPARWDASSLPGERACIPPNCGTVEVPGCAVPCAISFQDMGLASLACGSSKGSILTELMPALEMALASSCELSEEEEAVICTFSKVLSVREKTKDEKKAAHLVAARAHLKAVLGLAAVPEMAGLCLLPCFVLSPGVGVKLLLQLGQLACPASSQTPSRPDSNDAVCNHDQALAMQEKSATPLHRSPWKTRPRRTFPSQQPQRAPGTIPSSHVHCPRRSVPCGEKAARQAARLAVDEGVSKSSIPGISHMEARLRHRCLWGCR
jgi:hypothetical protein